MIWHVLTTMPQREFKAERELMNGLGLRTLVPYETRHRRAMGKGNRPVMVPYRVPLMPGYLFAGGTHGLPWRDVMEVRDIRGKVSFDGIPARLTDAQIDHVRRMAETTKVDTRRGLKVGDAGRITSGPFLDMPALVESIGLGSVEVTVEIFGRPTTTTVRPDMIERAA